MRRRGRDERGTVLIEAVVASVIILGVGLGGYWLASVVTRYHDLEEAVAAAARFGARNEYNPRYGTPSNPCTNSSGTNVCSTRRRTANEIVSYTTCAAHIDPVTTTAPTDPCPNYPPDAVNVDAPCGFDICVQVFCA